MQNRRSNAPLITCGVLPCRHRANVKRGDCRYKPRYNAAIKLFKTRNAFQWDAYRPLVDRILACTAQGGGGSVSQHALGRGVCIPACTGQGVCIPACTWQGVCIPACNWADNLSPPPWTETPVKT